MDFVYLRIAKRIVVFDDLAECQNTFFKVIGNQNSNERGYCLKPDSNGDLYLGGAANGESTITKIESNGNILWQKSFDLIVTDDEHITDIEITQDCSLLVTGYSINNNDAFLFKYNPTTSVVLWTQILEIGYRAFDIEKKVGTDNYLIE